LRRQSLLGFLERLGDLFSEELADEFGEILIVRRSRSARVIHRPDAMVGRIKV
jgi:hypothetical protein